MLYTMEKCVRYVGKYVTVWYHAYKAISLRHHRVRRYHIEDRIEFDIDKDGKEAVTGMLEEAEHGRVCIRTDGGHVEEVNIGFIRQLIVW